MSNMKVCNAGQANKDCRDGKQKYENQNKFKKTMESSILIVLWNSK